jgi:hypothetical protein
MQKKTKDFLVCLLKRFSLYSIENYKYKLVCLHFLIKEFVFLTNLINKT